MKKIKGFVRYIKEMFNTKDYEWIKSGYDYRKIAKFIVNNITYFVYFDEISANVYNMYFFFLDEDGNQIVDLIKNNDGTSVKILSNVLNCTLEFLDKRSELDFLGFSSTEDERDDLYMLFIQRIVIKGCHYSTKKIDNKKYYYMIKNDISKSIKDKYVDMLTKKDKKK